MSDIRIADWTQPSVDGPRIDADRGVETPDLWNGDVDADLGATDAPVVKPDAPVVKPDAPPKPDAPLKPDALVCPSGYTKVGQTCHKVVTSTTNWLTAEQNCEKDGVGAHLVIVDDAAENNALPDYVWIGISERATAGVFLTVTGKPQPFTAYAPGEPATGGGLCVVARPDGWHDDNCSESKKYVCEFDGVAADPSSY